MRPPDEVAGAIIAGTDPWRPVCRLWLPALRDRRGYQISQYVVSGDTTTLAYIALLFVGGAAVVAILNNWRDDCISS